ncbi:MAG: hypothetical protein L0154_13400 [Chloroflexi bacterium]|nr:hypothetical protein [Chloroflexota bacterium]
MSKNNQPLPETIDGALQWMLDNLDKENRQKLKNMKRHELIGLHHFYGTGIRNGLGLWGRNEPLVRALHAEGIWHPDDMSTYLIERLWAYLQDDTL